MGGFTLSVLGSEAVIAEFAIAAGASCVALAVFCSCANVLHNITRAVTN
jgi:hypothetical protein